MTQPLTIGHNNELTFDSKFDSWGCVKVLVDVYSGDPQLMLISKQDAIDLVDHLSTIYNLGGE